MNKKSFLLLFFLILSQFVFSDHKQEDEITWPIMPLMPLESEYPLILSDQNRFLLLESPTILDKNQNDIRSQLQSRHFPWMLFVGLGFAGLVWSFYVIRNQRPEVKENIPHKKDLTLSEKLELTFSEIQKHEWLKNHNVQMLYPKLEEILHEFLLFEKKYMTSTEYEKTLEHSTRFSLDEKKRIIYYLHTFDEVKFGRKIPSMKESNQITNEIHDLLSKK